MSDDERPVIMLAPVMPPEAEKLFDKLGVPRLPGAVQIDAECGHRVWISVSGLQATLVIPHRTICLVCVKRGGIPSDGEFGGMVPGADMEGVAAMGVDRYLDAVEHATAWARRMQRRSR